MSTTAIALIAAAAWSAPAGAGLLTTDAASGCDEASQVFAPWGDGAYYLLVPGGSFESGSPSWSLSGGASVVSGNEPFYVHDRRDRRSLYLPAGARATSPTVCFEFGDWHMRFFARNGAASGGSLEVDVLVYSALGLVSILDGGYVTADGTWEPSPKVSALLSNAGALVGTRAVAFRFHARGAAFQVDDVYLDPWKRT